ncbi:MAG: hypothetical protein ABR529_10760, partial [Actinomycetota bacterium]
MSPPATRPGALVDQTALWLPLLRSLTESSVERAVWKNIEAGLTGEGDVDFIAPVGEWDAIEHEFLRWARVHEVGPVVVCRHAPGALFLIALGGRDEPWLQLDVRAHATLRGATVFRVEDALPLIEFDGRGFRRLQAGAEGIFKLVTSGLAPGGRPNPRGLRKERVAELLRDDPQAAAAATHTFGIARAALQAGAGAVAAGGWDRGAMARVEAYVMLRGMRTPHTAVGQS